MIGLRMKRLTGGMRGASMAFSTALLLAGCTAQFDTRLTSGTVRETGLPPLAAQWRQSHASSVPSNLTLEWWSSFGSPELVGLLETAQRDSFDLAAAMARVRQAQAAASIAGSSLLPSVDASVGVTRAARSGGGSANTVDTMRYQAGLTASYELDFWGRNVALRDSAGALLRAAQFERDTVRLTLTAAVASAWMQTIGLRERLAIAGLSVVSARRILTVFEARARAGAANPLELAQQRALLAAQLRAHALLDQQTQDSLTTLALLLGRNPSLPVQVSAVLTLLQPPEIGAGVPAELITRRPDLARAEAQLAGASADIVAARAAMLPRLTLSAGLAVGGNRLGRLVDNPLYSLAAGLAAPIFNGGRLAAGHDLALAQREELLANYRRAIVAAFGDVETALNAVAGLDAQHGAQQDELEQARRALKLAESRYRAGAESSLTLLDAQRRFYTAQDESAQLHTLRLQAAVNLYKALGGEWQIGQQKS